MSSVKQKVLLLLYAGFGFAYAYHPGKKWSIVRNAAYQWQKINERKLKKEMDDLRWSQKSTFGLNLYFSAANLL